MGGCFNALCGSNRNNASIIWAAIVALILINCLDDDCLESVATFIVAVGDAMLLGTTSGCFRKCQCQDTKNCYY